MPRSLPGPATRAERPHGETVPAVTQSSCLKSWALTMLPLGAQEDGMEFSALTFRLLLLFLPGLVGFYLIVDKLTVHRRFKLHAVLLYSLLQGFGSYGVYGLIVWALLAARKIGTADVVFFRAIRDAAIVVDFREVALVTGISVILGFIVSAFISHKLLYRFARRLRITRKFGDLDVWAFLMTSPDVSAWVIVRDLEQDLMYAGYVQLFSESGARDELFLRDVTVYRNSTAEERYQTPGLYLPRARRHLLIEFPFVRYDQQHSRREESNEGQEAEAAP